MWIGGHGFFGSVDEDFVYHDLSKKHFSKEIDTALPILWLYETGSWIHFANNTTLFHFNRDTLECKTTQFEGMFDAYHWVWDGQLYLGTQDQIQIWEKDHFEKRMDWPHKYRAFVGWKHEDKSYFLHATHLFVYNESGQLIDTIKDDLMKMRGANHLMIDHHLLIITQAGIIKMHRDGNCDGYYTPWFHKKITLSEIVEQSYFGGSDVWLLTDTAIFRINLDSNTKELGVETGYNITGAWDMEIYEDSLYTTSKQGFRRWNPNITDFEFADENSPDFESNYIFEAYGKLYISSWVELGNFENDTYTYVHSDGAYGTFATSKKPEAFWVVKDSGLRRMNAALEIVDELPLMERISSMAEFNNEIWVSTLEGRILRNEDTSQIQFEDLTNLLSDSGQQGQDIVHTTVFLVHDRLFVLTPDNIWEWNGATMIDTGLSPEKDWKWVIPGFSNQDERVLLVQEHPFFQGRKMGEFLIDRDNNTPLWEPAFIHRRVDRNELRRIKLLGELEGTVAALISQSSLELINLDAYSEQPTDPIVPKVVSTIDDFKTCLPKESEGTYEYKTDIPLMVQLYSPEATSNNPLIYFGRLKGTGDDSWIQNDTGKFSFYGIQRGKQTFEGYVVNAFKNRSPIVTYTLNVVPPWYLRNFTIAVYILTLLVLIFVFVQFQTKRLRKQAKILQKKVDAQTHDLIQANQAKSIFVSNVSHEIRNPLNGLLGLAQNLNEGDVIDSDIIQRLRRPSLYLYRFLSNVLDFSKFESGGIRFTNRVFDANDLIESVETMFSGEFKDRGITFAADYRYEDEPFLVSSQEAIEMILVNLVGNALKYTPRDGCIRVALLKKDQQLSLSVSDTGIGIKEKDIKRIFEPYQQGEHSPLIAGEKGAGIGLSLVKKTIEELQGHFDIGSEEGVGTKFICSFPYSNPTVVKKVEVIDQVSLEGDFLIVEDLEYNMKLFADLLKKWGATVHEAFDGHTAIEMALEHSYAMIFVDFDLPDIAGNIVTQSIREHSKNKQTPIIGLSAYTDQEYIQKGLKSGMNDYLFKPLNATKLVDCIKEQAPEKIHYTTLPDNISSNTRSSLSRILGKIKSSNQKRLQSKTQDYLQTLDQLISDLQFSDIGSENFDRLIHQLKGHCSFINHRESVAYWERLEQLSQSGDRLALLDEMKTIVDLTIRIKKEVSALSALELDYADLNNSKESSDE